MMRIGPLPNVEYFIAFSVPEGNQYKSSDGVPSQNIVELA